MSSPLAKWGLSHTDEASGVLVLKELFHGTLEIYQTESHSPDPLLLATFKVASTDPVPVDQSDEDVPWSLKWSPHPNLGFLGTANLDASPELKVQSFARTMSEDHCVRSVGGRDHEVSHPRALHVRGGYLFAKASSPDDELAVKGRAHPKQLVLAVNLSINKGKVKYAVPLLYDKDPRSDWIYDEHSFNLSFIVNVAGRTWRADGPTIKSPVCEFLSDASKVPAVLKKDLSKEYGNLSAVPPLQARDFSNCLMAKSPVVEAFLEYLLAAANFVNGQLPTSPGFVVTPIEIASTMLSEGGVVVIRNAIRSGRAPDKISFGGYADLGIDSYATRWKGDEGNLRAFTKDLLLPYLTDPKRHNLETVPDEQSHPYATFKKLNLEEAVYAVTGMYAFFKERFALATSDEAVMGPWASNVADLPLHVQHFWCSYFFNTSSGKDRGTERMQKQSVEFHDLGWNLEDDFEKYRMYGQYHATWRTAAFRLLQRISPFGEGSE